MVEEIKKEMENLDYSEKSDVFDFYHKWFMLMLDELQQCNTK